MNYYIIVGVISIISLQLLARGIPQRLVALGGALLWPITLPILAVVSVAMFGIHTRLLVKHWAAWFRGQIAEVANEGERSSIEAKEVPDPCSRPKSRKTLSEYFFFTVMTVVLVGVLCILIFEVAASFESFVPVTDLFKNDAVVKVEEDGTQYLLTTKKGQVYRTGPGIYWYDSTGTEVSQLTRQWLEVKTRQALWAQTRYRDIYEVNGTVVLAP